MHIIGTAGHVDHGKSSLVKALTGVDPDRLPEEKRRALTIELGFASYRDKEGRTIGVIDVPGHERFIRNMVAGTWALDCALLVIAADDGWMRQTEDHAHVLKGMGVPSVIMVITKSDLATEERLKAVAADARQRSLALFGYGIDTIFTSATRGEGIEELKELIDHHLARITPRHMPPCLQVDRSFIMSGTGPVVTGSLRGTTLSVGDEVTILPSCMKARVRSLQTFGDLVESASDGTRTAVGLQGVSSKDLHKGDCLTRHPAWFAVGTQAMLLLEAPYADGELGIRNHAQLEAASGTWHDSCAIHLLDRTTRTPRLAKIVCPHAKAWYWRQPVMLMHPGSSSVAALGSVISTRQLDKQEVQQLRELVGQHRGIPENVSGSAFWSA